MTGPQRLIAVCVSLTMADGAVTSAQTAEQLVVAGQMAQQAGDCDAAITSYDRALDAGADDPLFFLAFARCLENEGDIDRAIELFQEYLAAAPEALDTPDVETHVAELEERQATEAAAEAGYREALALRRQGDHGRELALLRQLAERGHPAASYELALYYDTGTELLAQDRRRARQLLADVAASGHTPAMARLGMMAEFGIAGPHSDRDALAWYRRGADGGNAAAMHGLGRLYGTGRGIPANLEEAVRWFRRAAAAGDGAATLSLAWALTLSLGTPADPLGAERLLTDAILDWENRQGTPSAGATLYVTRAYVRLDLNRGQLAVTDLRRSDAMHDITRPVPTVDAAAACVLARLGHAEPALSRLEAAIGAGFGRPMPPHESYGFNGMVFGIRAWLASEACLGGLRDTPRAAQLLTRIPAGAGR